MECPEASELTDYLGGAMPPSGRAELEVHLDRCGDCRRTVALLARELPAHGPPEPDEAPEAVALARTLADPARPLELGPGVQAGRYLILERIGAGAMGVVYAAEDAELERTVALKILGGERRGRTDRRRVLAEARAMAQITHENVLPIHDVGLLGDHIYLAVELVRGSDLRSWLAARERSIAEILQVFTAAGRGLAAAHDAGLVHRDFKPDNVLVGEDGRVRVTDFGLAIEVRDGDEELEGRGAAAGPPGIAGTPGYMAPEQLAGGRVDARSDQFSFAVALHEALHGERPFAGDTIEALAEATREGRLRPPPAGRAIPGTLRAILLRGLAPRPGDRFPSMDAMLRALARDRARAPRRIAVIALAALAAAGLAFASDALLRDRARAVARTSFEAARGQLVRLLEARGRSFAAMADLLAVSPVMREVASTVDQSDFGLGEPADDRRQLAYLHDALASADWFIFMRAAQAGEVAVADYKGRLLFTSADRSRWGDDLLRIPAVAGFYRAGEGPTAAVVRGDDPEVVRSGLLGDAPAPGLRLLLARTTLVGRRPRAVFIQEVGAAALAREVKPDDATLLALVAGDGTFAGDAPSSVVTRAVASAPEGGAMVELEIDGAAWLVQRQPLVSPGGTSGVATILLARKFDVGLSGLFPGARRALAACALMLALLALCAGQVARRRDLARVPRRRAA